MSAKTPPPPLVVRLMPGMTVVRPDTRKLLQFGVDETVEDNAYWRRRLHEKAIVLASEAETLREEIAPLTISDTQPISRLPSTVEESDAMDSEEYVDGEENDLPLGPDTSLRTEKGGR